ncbi:MAG TPA: hypothetical protein VE592_06240 [Geminicoccaceae bacterium]|jgi:hypothetical protein|nr:hypothetical protein [Geminicoccaceae bacterium]
MWFLKREATPPNDPGAALRAAIRERVERAAAGDLAASGDAADEVQRLTQLLAAYEQTRPRPPRRAWPVVALLLAIAVAVSLLLFLRVPSTEVTLALELSSLGFRIGNDPEPGAAEHVGLLGRIITDEMTIDDVDAVEVDDVPVPEVSDFKLRATGAGAISLRPLEVPVGTWVRVDRPDPAGALTLELAHPRAELQVVLTLPEGIEVLPPGSGLARALSGGSGGQRVLLRAERPGEGGQCARLRLRWRASASPGAAAGADPAPFQGALPVDALLLSDLDGAAERAQVSTVLGGALYLEAVAGREVALRRHQLLDVGLGPIAQGAGARAGELCAVAAPAPASARGRLWRIAVGPEAIALEAEATVSRLSTGTAAYRRDLMPRWLEWLQSRQELLLFWGAFGSLFGLAYTALLWWRGTR